MAHPARRGSRTFRTQRALALILLVCLSCLCLPAFVVADGALGPPPASVRALMYHYIRADAEARDQLGRNLSVAPEDLEAEVQLLAQSGCTSVSPDDLVAAREGTAELPPNAVILTFDDGYADFYTNAWPILQRYGFKATVYVITGRLDTPGYLTWDQVRELDSAGITIGSHTITHPRLTSLSDVALDQELRGSRQTLEEGLGHPVVHFAYPSGALDPRVATAVAAAGYQTAMTTRSGVATANLDPLTLPRLRVSNHLALSTFARVVGAPVSQIK